MQNILFITIGTRDLQLPPEVQIEDQLLEHFRIGNADTGKNLVVNRDDFLSHTQAILEAYDQLKDRVIFPMVEKSIELAGENIQEIVLVSTCQEPNDVQDTYFLGQFIRRRLHEKGFVVHEHPITFPPIDFEQLVEFFTNLYEMFIEYQIFFGNSGGTPDMRAASHFAGMFRNIQFITLQARTGQADMRNFDRQERLVLLHTVEKMLDAYDYEGIINLPVGEEIKQLCKEALDLYNLKTDIIDEKANFGEKSRKAINLLLNNLEVCFAQGRYADVIGRIFRIEEAVGQMLVHDGACALGVINEDDKVQRTNSKGKVEYKNTFENTLANRNNSIDFYTQHFSDLFEEDELKNDWKFKQFPNVFLRSGKPFFFFFFRSLRKYQKLYDFFENLNDGFDFNRNRLGELRNRSYLGHGFRGVSKEDIEEITGEFQAFFQKLCELLVSEAAIDYSPIFKEVNERIETLL